MRRPGNIRNLGDFGNPAALVVIAAGQVAVNAVTAVKEQKINRQFAKQFDSDEQKLDYIKNVALRFQGVGRRLTNTTPNRPGTTLFEKELQKRLLQEMIYRGQCNADIFVPPGPKDVPGDPRPLIGKFARSGYVAPGSQQFPPEAGPIWSSRCKNAQDEFSILYLDSRKKTGKLDRLKAQIEDIGVTGIFLKFGLGMLFITAMLMAVSTQKKVLVYEKKAKTGS